MGRTGLILITALIGTSAAQVDARVPARQPHAPAPTPANMPTVSNAWITPVLAQEEASGTRRWMIDSRLGEYPEERDVFRIRPHGAGVKMKMVM